MASRTRIYRRKYAGDNLLRIRELWNIELGHFAPAGQDAPMSGCEFTVEGLTVDAQDFGCQTAVAFNLLQHL